MVYFKDLGFLKESSDNILNIFYRQLRENV
jgi:hypothetical protein